jgi:hypothetical protein
MTSVSYSQLPNKRDNCTARRKPLRWSKKIRDKKNEIRHVRRQVRDLCGRDGDSWQDAN